MFSPPPDDYEPSVETTGIRIPVYPTLYIHTQHIPNTDLISITINPSLCPDLNVPYEDPVEFHFNRSVSIQEVNKEISTAHLTRDSSIPPIPELLPDGLTINRVLINQKREINKIMKEHYRSLYIQDFVVTMDHCVVQIQIHIKDGFSIAALREKVGEVEIVILQGKGGVKWV